MNIEILKEMIENHLPKESDSGLKEYDSLILDIFTDIYIPKSYRVKKISESPNYKKFEKEKDEFWKGFAVRVQDFLIAMWNIPESHERYNILNEDSFYVRIALSEIYKGAVRTMRNFSEEEIVRLSEKNVEARICNEEYHLGIKQMQNFLKKNSATDILKNHIKYMLGHDEIYIKRHYQEKNAEKIRLAVQEMYNKITGTASEVPAVLWSDEDSFGKGINEDVAGFAEDEKKTLYYKIFHAFKKASGGKPGAKYIKETEELIQKIGEKHFYEHSLRWMKLFLDYEVKKETITSEGYNGREYHYDRYYNISGVNADSLKAMIWSAVTVLDEQMIRILGQIAEKSYKKIPGKGPANAAVGNACFYTLAASQNMEAISILSRLKLRLKQSSVIKLIDSYISEFADEKGVSPHDIEDMAVQEYGLVKGCADHIFGDYKVHIEIRRVGDVEVQWTDSKGRTLKSVPASAKTEFKSDLKKMNEDLKEIQKTLTVQRDRLDRSYIYERKWSWKDFEKRFTGHGLMYCIAKNLIWNLHSKGKTEVLLFDGENWINEDGHSEKISDIENVSLWHPAGQGLETVMKWRELILSKELVQPFKQAYREIYLLTDAEVRTAVYSNRMAAHILKQHQMNTLMKGRTWTYSLLGAYDDGRDGETARLQIPAHGLTAQFWIQELFIQDAFNDAGIWDFVGTDQVRFVNAAGQAQDLTRIPVLIFSEVMRDVDLFVGVASVGNDPEWRDRGDLSNAQRTYWEGYSFGDLNEMAKMRKSILEKILPRLKIASVAEIKDKFLVVKGKKRTYKIHIGSTNILMEPNDQYLCIVPDRKKDINDKIFLSFEGDNGLSLLISKAFLLAEDDKIKDETIIRQIEK